MKRVWQISIVMALLIGATAGLKANEFATKSVLTFLFDEPWRSDVSRAFIVLVTRVAQDVRNGEIVGEATWSRETLLPKWTNPTNDPLQIDCDLQIVFPETDETLEEFKFFRSDRLLAVGPAIREAENRASVTIVYEGKGIEFVDILSSDRVEEIFRPAPVLAKQSTSGDGSSQRPPFERDDETRIFGSVILGANVTYDTHECGAYSFTAFEFDSPYWRVN